jgi:short-chain Z-isoprenyl diphosphate synthase
MGRTELLPERVQAAIAKAEAATAHYRRRALNIGIAYGGREEIVDAFKGLLRSAAAAGESLEDLAARLRPDDLAPHLQTAPAPDPDLIIRTSGEVRLSGFLLWQSAHSEFYFCDTNWPAFRKLDFLRALRSYHVRQRRFGR